MKKLTIYETRDGTRFDNEAAAQRHGCLLDDIDAANEMLSNGATLMAALTRAYRTQPDWDDVLTAGDRPLLMNVTKDTALGGTPVCRGAYAYKLRGVTPSGASLVRNDSEMEHATISTLVALIRLTFKNEDQV